MAYTLNDLRDPAIIAAVNGTGIGRTSPTLARLRASVHDGMAAKFTNGNPGTLATAASNGYRTLEEAARKQALVEGRLLEHAVAGTPVRDAFLDVANENKASLGLVQAIADRMAISGEVTTTGGHIRLAKFSIPEIDKELALPFSQAIHAGIKRLSEIHPDVTYARSQLAKHPFFNIIDNEGTLYGVFEPTTDKSQWLNKELLAYVIRLRSAPASRTTILTMMTGEPIFPKDYLQAPDFVPDYLYTEAGTLWDDAKRWQMLHREQSYRVTLRGERIIGTTYGTPFTSASCPDYEQLELTVEPKDPEKVWTENRKLLFQGIALEILQKGREHEFEMLPQVNSLVDLASGRDKYDATKIRSRLESGQHITDASLLRIMTYAGRKGLMGTSLGSHYRLYDKQKRGR